MTRLQEAGKVARCLSTLLVPAVLATACGSPSSLPAPSANGPLSTDPKDFAEALLLGSGPLSNLGDRSCGSGVVIGWAAGSVITVRASGTLGATALDSIRQVVGRTAEATLGNVTAGFEVTNEQNPSPTRGEITVSVVEDPARAGCPSGAILCTAYPCFAVPFICSAKIVGIADGNFPHEMGHAVFGFCHLRNPNAFSNDTIMGGAWRLTDMDVGIVQSLYRAGLGPGATRSDLVRAGIVNP